MPVNFDNLKPITIPPEKLEPANLVVQMHILAELRAIRSQFAVSISLKEKQDVATFEKLWTEQVESNYNGIVAYLSQKFGE